MWPNAMLHMYRLYMYRMWQGAVRFPKLLEGRQAKHYIWKKGFTMDVVNRQPFIRYLGARLRGFLWAHASMRGRP